MRMEANLCFLAKAACTVFPYSSAHPNTVSVYNIINIHQNNKQMCVVTPRPVVIIFNVHTPRGEYCKPYSNVAFLTEVVEEVGTKVESNALLQWVFFLCT